MPLQKPTVSQIIELLQTMPADAPFRVDTALMQGREDVVHIDQDVLGCVWVSGEPGGNS